MSEHILISLAGILALGIGAQWIAWRLGLPSILLLLIFGIAVGPITGLIQPDELFGDLLTPIVSLSVAVILFEGSLSLRFHELRDTGSVVRNLITVGAVVTWAISTVAAMLLLGFNLGLALLLGSILVVTGPTVIGPLLQHVKPRGRLASTLKWEGILIDPIGALLALLIFEAIRASELQHVPTLIIAGFFTALAVGITVGAAGAGLMILLLRRYMIPDRLQSPVTLTLVVVAVTVSRQLYPESGLLAVTVMGIILANQKFADVERIIEFKENLRPLLLAVLFILLAARLRLEDLQSIGLGSVLFLAVLLFVARPLTVAVSTIGSKFSIRERIFLAWIAPRGIVAASVASIFALRLERADTPGAGQLVVETFFVIIGTVAIYGLTAAPVAAWLGVKLRRADGALIVGADRVARAIAQALQDAGFAVLLVDTNRGNVSTAKLEGLPAIAENILAERLLAELELEGIGRLFALTPNEDINSLAALRFHHRFGRAEVYQLPAKGPVGADQGKGQHPLRGRLLFRADANHSFLGRQLAEGATIKATKLTEQFDFEAFQARYHSSALPLFLITESQELVPFTVDVQPVPRVGQIIISLIPADATSSDVDNGAVTEPSALPGIRI